MTTRAKVVMFSHNRFDAAVVRRIEMFRESDAHLVTFSFRRDDLPARPNAAWRDIDLGLIEHKRFGRRLLRYLSAVRVVWSNREAIREADVLHARNLDVCLFMLGMAALSGRRAWRARRVYEAIDVHLSMTASGWRSVVLRWLERRALACCDLLIVSSPGFLRHYFVPRQRVRVPVLLVENKLRISFDALDQAHEIPADVDVDDSPVIAHTAASVTSRLASGVRVSERRRSTVRPRPRILVWAGIIRCQRSLMLLRAVALAMSEQLEIRICGRVSRFLIPDFDAQIDSVANLSFQGPFTWPDGLRDVYRGADYCWAQDFSEAGHNSQWLLPNRVYEASCFGVQSIAVRGSETARFIEANEIGHVIDEASPEALIALLTTEHGRDDRARRQSLIRRRQRFMASRRDSLRLTDACLGRNA